MKKTYTLNLILCALVMVFTSQVNAQDCPPPDYTPNYFWGTETGEGDFSNGFGDWTTNVLSVNDDQTEDWEIIPDGVPSFNQFFGSNVVLTSPTFCNGAAHYSFVKHNITDNPNPGSPPYDMYISELISPVIDCSGKTNVTVSYYQAYNSLNGTSQFSFSTDGGTTWSAPTDIADSGGAVDQRLVAVPLPELDDVSEARIKFIANGDFYYWSVDDVTFREDSQPDLYVASNFIAGALVYGTPVDQLDIMPFLADVQNQSGATSEGSTMTVEVINEASETLFTTSYDYGTIRGNTNDGENLASEETFRLPAVPGVYQTTYTIVDEDDIDPSNNSLSVTYEVTEDAYKKVLSEEEADANYLRATRFGSTMPVKSYGSGFYVKSSKNLDGVQRTLDGVRCGFEPENRDEGFTAGTVYLDIFSWVDINQDGLTAMTEGGTLELTNEASFNMTVLGSTTIEEVEDLYLVPLTEDGEILLLEDDTQYFAVLTFEPFTSGLDYRILYDAGSVNRQFNDNAAELAYDTLATRGVLDIKYKQRKGAIGGLNAAYGDLAGSSLLSVGFGTFFVNPRLGIPDGVNDINENLGVSIYPTPASDYITVDLDLENVSDIVSIDIVTISGSVVKNKVYDNIRNESLRLDVSNLPTGSYIMNIRTEEGMISKKVSVVR